MNKKTKLAFVMLSMCMVIALGVIGILAVKTLNMAVGGNIVFSATGMNATITLLTDKQNLPFAEALPDGNTVLAPITVTTNHSEQQIESQMANWQNLNFAVQEDERGLAKDFELSFRITNTSTNDKEHILVTMPSTIEGNNLFILCGASTVVAPGAENARDFTLKFCVDDKETNASLNDFLVEIGLELKTPDQVEKATEYEQFKFTVDPTTHTAIVEAPDNFASLGVSVVDIPAYISDNDNIYAVTEVPDDGFDAYEKTGCAAITSVTLPSTMLKIGSWGFGSINISEVIVPDSVEYLGTYAFGGCDRLQSAVIGSGLKNTLEDGENGAFQENEALETAKFKYGTKYIHESFFFGCSKLKTVEIPNSVTGIGLCAFGYCYKLEEVKLPIYLEKIYECAFSVCIGLKSLTIPKTVTFIENQVVDYCNNLEKIVVEKGNPVYDSRNNCNAIIETATNKLIDTCKNSYIPNDIKIIGTYAFDNQATYVQIVIPEGVETIEDDAFRWSDIYSIVLPSTIKTMTKRAFSYSNTVKEVINKSSVALSGVSGVKIVNNATDATKSEVFIENDFAFYQNTALKYLGDDLFVTIPSTYDNGSKVVNSIFHRCFADTTVCSVTIPSSITETSIRFNDAIVKEYINQSSATISDSSAIIISGQQAQTATSTLGYVDDFVVYPIENNEYAIYRYMGDEMHITTPTQYSGKPVTKIDMYFLLNPKYTVHMSRYFGSVKSIVVSEGIKEIKGWAFEYITTLEEIVLPNSLQTIGDALFEGYYADVLYKKTTEKDGLLYLGNETNPYLMLYDIKDWSLTSCKVDANCKFIRNDLFSEIENISSIDFSASTFTWKDSNGATISNANTMEEIVSFLKNGRTLTKVA